MKLSYLLSGLEYRNSDYLKHGKYIYFEKLSLGDVRVNLLDASECNYFKRNKRLIFECDPGINIDFLYYYLKFNKHLYQFKNIFRNGNNTNLKYDDIYNIEVLDNLNNYPDLQNSLSCFIGLVYDNKIQPQYDMLHLLFCENNNILANYEFNNYVEYKLIQVCDIKDLSEFIRVVKTYDFENAMFHINLRRPGLILSEYLMYYVYYKECILDLKKSEILDINILIPNVEEQKQIISIMKSNHQELKKYADTIRELRSKLKETFNKVLIDFIN